MSSKPTAAPQLVAPVAAAIDGLVDAVSEGRVRDLGHDELTGLVTGPRREQARLEAIMLGAVGAVGEVEGSNAAASTPDS